MTTRGSVALQYFFRQRGVSNIDRTYNKLHLQKNPTLTKPISVKTLSEDFKLAALEKYEFENRQFETNYWTLSHVKAINISI